MTKKDWNALEKDLSDLRALATVLAKALRSVNRTDPWTSFADSVLAIEKAEKAGLIPAEEDTEEE